MYCCGLCVNHFPDARTIQEFGRADEPAFLSMLRCTGSEDTLNMCPVGRTRDDRCRSAGVACGKSASKHNKIV